MSTDASDHSIHCWWRGDSRTESEDCQVLQRTHGVAQKTRRVISFSFLTLFSESCIHYWLIDTHSPLALHVYAINIFLLYVIVTFNCCTYTITVRFTEANKKCYREICFRVIEWGPNIHLYLFYCWDDLKLHVPCERNKKCISLNWVNLVKGKWIFDWLSLLLYIHIFYDCNLS